MTINNTPKRTLADCRKEASRFLKREGVALSDTLLAAFQDYRRLLAIVCEDVAQDRWTWRRARETQEGLTLSIQLLEFYMVYTDFGSIYELRPDWPLQHVDKNLAMIRTDGQSYGDALFRLLRDQGGFTILRLQMARTEHIKGPGIQYVCPFSFLNETPDVNDLEVFPQPHVIIRTLFDYVIGGLQKMLLERGLSPLTISREFQIVSRRVRAEGTDTPQSLDVEATESAGKHDARVALQPEDIPAASLQLTDNAFRRCGERAFLVRFQGCQPRVIGRKKGDLPGLDEIHVLLQHEAKHHAEPHRVMCSMTSHEVRQAEVGDYSGGDNGESPEKRIDEKGFAAIQKERRRLQAILDDDGADPAERAEAQQELASLDEASKRDTRPGRKGAKSKMLRAPKSDSIRKNIDRAITVIEEQDPALAAHFKAFIKHTPEGHSYAPDVHIDWDLG